MDNQDLASMAAELGRETCDFSIEEITERLYHAQEKNAFYLDYQPIIDVRTNRVYAAESLLRWYDDTLGNVPASKFIPIAEKQHLIQEIDEWVFKNTCEQCHNFHAEGFTNLRMSVNLSLHMAASGDYITTVQKIIQETKVQPRHLVFEIPVNYLYQRHDEAVSMIQRMHKMGSEVLLDSFGEDHLDIDRLKDLPIRGIKVDRKFVLDIASNPRSVVTLRSILELGRALSIDVIAVGVENVDQLDILNEYQCHIIQGFMLSEPISPQLLASFLAD